ncbi:MAG: MarR family transcriptional regulator [Bryobacterales bacterium]
MPGHRFAKPPGSVLEAHLGYWLRRVSNHVSGSFAKSLQDRNVSVAEWVALSHINEHPEVRPNELADAMGMTRGAISKVVDKLEAKKWVARKTLAADSRGHSLFLTRQGHRALPELRAVADRNDQRFFDCLDAKEKAALEALLRKLTTSNDIRNIPVE